MASPVKLNSVPNRGGRPSGRRSHELEVNRAREELRLANARLKFKHLLRSARSLAEFEGTTIPVDLRRLCQRAAREHRDASYTFAINELKQFLANHSSATQLARNLYDELGEASPLAEYVSADTSPAKTPRTRAIADIAQQVRSLCGTMSAVAHQVQDLQARFPAPPPQPPAPAPVVQPVMTLAPPAQVLAPAVPPPAPAPDAAHAGQAALGTAPAQVSGMDGTMSLVLNRVQQPNPLSQNVTSAPAIAKSYRQPPAFNGTTSAQVTEPDAWFDTVIQYLRDTNANPIEGLRYYCTGEVLTWYNSFNRKCKDTNQQLTLEALRTDFIELFGDINRDTPHQVRERLDKHEHAMKPGESVPAYVQRF
ncbi:hypothetical protein Vretimale_5399 [Volvox reticuliferus]|uniref:Uncharacterized protein n=1 Tax=Volvox reticuliferus TaxID=1737510 RepID=A0A8J4C2X3_9CHLO|nr:hypothetical protein Vretifemale_3845 [Volvox reticuliferus]GIM00256.1 hypothetical protein Vretimale_5399 [Volvox reticuliferus]